MTVMVNPMDLNIAQTTKLISFQLIHTVILETQYVDVRYVILKIFITQLRKWSECRFGQSMLPTLKS